MTYVSTRRPHLAERAVEAARMAELAAKSERHPPQPHLVATPAPAQDPPARPEQTEIPPGVTQIAREHLVASGLVAPARGRARIAEQIALVRDQMLRTVETAASEVGRHPNIIIVTSARPGEGKSFTALNLAASIAEGTGRPALLVDTEGGTGSLSDRLGLADAPGLDALCGAADFNPAQVIRPTALDGLTVLTRGRTAAGAAQGSTIAATLARLAALRPGHMILVDTPACLAASTAGLLARTAGQVIMVVQAERTQRAEVEAALDVVDACPNLQLVLNQLYLAVSDSFGDGAAAGDVPQHPVA